MRLLVVGGGSAGHVLPARPVIERFIARGDEVVFVGTNSGLEAQLVDDLQLEFRSIASGKLRRYWSWENFTDVFRILLGCVQAVTLMLRLKPAVVFSKGGFVSFPIVFAAWLTRVPVVAHESDITPGLANRLALPFIKTLCVSFPGSHDSVQRGGKARVVHTGTPIRAQILEGDAARGRAALNLALDKPLLVVTGGSLGADRLNAIVRDAAATLCETFHVLHTCGANKVVPLSIEGYQPVEYVTDGWGDILAAADIVVSRAGANALFELLALRKKTLLVPLTAAASRGDQIDNAAYAVSAGLSRSVAEDALTSERLCLEVNELMQPDAELEAALAGFTVPDAVSLLVDELDRVAKTRA